MHKVCNENWTFILLLRPPNQSLEEFETFSDICELTLGRIYKSNHFSIVFLGDCNSKLGNSYKSDSSSYEGAQSDSIT